MIKKFVGWNQQEQLKLIQLYQKYGKSYTKLCQQMRKYFKADHYKYTINRISSRMNTIMRQGFLTLINLMKGRYQFHKSIEKMSSSKIIVKIMALQLDDQFDRKCKLISLKHKKYAANQDIQDIIDFINQRILEQPKTKQSQKLAQQRKKNVKRKIIDKLRQIYIQETQTN